MSSVTNVKLKPTRVLSPLKVHLAQDAAIWLLPTVCIWALLGQKAMGDFTFGIPSNIEIPLNSAANDGTYSFSRDGLELYLASDRPGGYGHYDLYVMTRESVNAEWTDPANMGTMINSPDYDSMPCISPDGLELYFSSGNIPDLWVAKRATVHDAWGLAVNLGSVVNSSAWDQHPTLSPDGLTLCFESNRSGDGDLWVTTRSSSSGEWEMPVNLGTTVNTEYNEWYPRFSPDGLILFFSSNNRPGGFRGIDLWMATRATIEDEWSVPKALPQPINTPANEAAVSLSLDGSILYFASNRPGGLGGWDQWQAPVLPIVDFDGDGQVDGKEVLTLTDHWGLDDPLCDIGPTPLGDGIVDLKDVVVLAGYLGKEVKDTTLIAHWALDETGGFVASDSARENDAFMSGNAIWHADGGAVGGAIELDGVDDCLMTQSFMDPAEQPFSVLAWIKGGAAGQTIISQSGTTDWLCIDPVDGTLMSKLSHNSWNAAPLASGVVITDGQWHRVGFVWDGITRALYVDEQEVIRDGQPQLESSDKGLIIGGGALSLAGTYFGGMIDDVRIYNRVVRP